MLLVEKGLAEGDVVDVPKLAEDAGGGVGEQALSLTSLKDAVRVNALTPGQEIEFNPRVTVLFGENGCGKTGYVRVLKQLAAVRTAEDVHSNIRRPEETGPPEATVGYELGGGVEVPYEWTGERGVRPFTRMDVFDARAVNLHVDEDLKYFYTPSDLALFRLVHDGIEAVRDKFEQARKDTLPKGNVFLERFSKDSRLYPEVEALGAATDLNKLREAATVSPEEEAAVPTLKETVDALQSRGAEERLRLARSRKELFDRVLEAAQVFERFDMAGYSSAVAALGIAEDRHREATIAAFDADEIPGALGDAWRAFIEAGEIYLQEVESPEYPRAGDSCSYCRQPLNEAAVELIQKYRDFTNNELKKAVSDARAEIARLTSAVLNKDLAHLEEDLGRESSNYDDQAARPAVLIRSLGLVAAASEVQTKIRSRGELSTDVLLTELSETIQLTEAFIAEAAVQIAGLSEEADKRRDTLAKKKAELIELETRIALRDLLPRIVEHVDAAKWAERAKTHVSRFRGLFRGLTEASKTASEQLLNQDFERTFQVECQALRAPSVTLDFPGRSGQSVRRKSLVSRHRLSDILSEGEQKVIALADFIAEGSLRKAGTPLILDDPVTSLDYKRLQYVVRRLVELSRERQVIVFTHNIWFTMEILAQFEQERESCTYYDVSEEGEAKGIVSRGNSPRLDRFSDKRGRINSLIQTAKSADAGEARSALIEKAYEDMRGVCEIIVEQDLLQNVTQRYQPNVMMTRLPGIRADRLPAAIAVVMPVFEKCCRYIASHSQPLETLNVRPSLDELEQDWAGLQAARSDYLAK